MRSHLRSCSRITGAIITGAIITGATVAAAVFPGPTARAAPLTFEQHVRPIFKVACFHCHGEDGEAKGELDLRLVRLMAKGGRSGPALTPASATASLIWKRIAADEMPRGKKKLSAAEKAIVRRWIEEGARTARPEPDKVEDARFTVEELGHWSFQPVAASVTVPQTESAGLYSTPIDSFIASRLAREGLSFSPPANRRTLIRRVTFDLLGLPPSPEEVETFVNDSAPDAYARLIDRLLASPQLGVRWGRHWLDVAGFAETHGGRGDSDPKRPNAWRYRDYVVNAFNQGKRIDEFYREQLAGDEILLAEFGAAKLDVNNQRQLELLTATAFLRMAPDLTQISNTLEDRNNAAAAALEVISTSLLGLTVGCAQCHDHKYDPIGIDDYYRFRAIFDPVFPLKSWQTPGNRVIDMTTAAVRKERERIEAEATRLEKEWNARRLEFAKEIQKRKLADVPADVRDAVHVAAETDGNKRTPEERRLLELYPMVKSIQFIRGFLVEYDNAAYRKFEAEKAKFESLRATKPPLRTVMATQEQPGVVPVSAVFFRGNPESRRETVSPAELTVLRQAGRSVPIPSNADSAKSSSSTSPSTGRRLAYAQQLTDGEHPLAARVFVNRVWLHLLGRGIVATPSDFGLSGARPSHPQLLEWLTRDFAAHDWDVKRLQRMILLSGTYRQSSRRRPEHDAVDPDNAWFARANLRRLEAEAIRDSILAVTGTLDRALGGPSISVNVNDEGKVVTAAQGSGNSRRSAYVEVQRRRPLNMLATFDQPEMSPNCDVRRHTTVATQALWFLNDRQMVQHAGDLARRLIAASDEPTTRLKALFALLYSHPPSKTELRDCRAFLDTQENNFLKDGALAQKRELHALASLCQVLLASNRFLYID